MKTKLDAIEFWTLVGIQTMAMEVDKQMIALVRAVAKVTGEGLDQYDYGFASDMVYAPDGSTAIESVRQMLGKLDIVHEEELKDEVPDSS